MTSLVTYPQERPWHRWGGAAFVTLASMALSVPPCVAQVLTKGVSVEEAVTSHAVAMPDADKVGAIVVAVTHNGDVYFGIDPVTPAALSERLGPSGRAGEKIYIKADARTPYADVARVLDAARTAGVTAPNLLTNQPETRVPGKLAPPTGLDVWVGPPWPSGTASTVVHLLSSGQPRPRLKINDEVVSWDALPTRLAQLLQNRSEKTVLVRADGQLPFAAVVRAVDVCRSTGARVFLAVPDDLARVADAPSRSLPE
jgi:biopolymer transport protein ExbD